MVVAHDDGRGIGKYDRPEHLPRMDERLVVALAELGIDASLIGRVAVTLLAEPRFTCDLDAVIMYDTEDTTSLIEALARHDLSPLFDGG